MRKLAIVLLLSTALAGCAGTPKSIIDGGTSIIATTSNPVTPKLLYELEAGLTLAASAAVTYRRLCRSGAIPASCKAVVIKIGTYAHTVRVMLPQLRTFVKNHDEVNAIVLFNEIRVLILNLQTAAAGA